MKWYLPIVILLVVLASMTGCSEEEPEETTSGSYIDVTPAEARELIDNNPDLIIIDVSPVYDQGHLPGAVSYYLGDGSLDDAIPNLDKNGKYLVYCHSTSVAITGSQKLIDAGFETVYRLDGNYSAWVSAGYEVETLTASFIDVTPSEARELIDNNPDLIIIDVSPVYDQGHLPGAIHYYLGDGSLDDAIPTLDKDATYLVYCHVDSVAIAGAQKLIDAGFMKVYRLEGNYSAWVAAGYEVET